MKRRLLIHFGFWGALWLVHSLVQTVLAPPSFQSLPLARLLLVGFGGEACIMPIRMGLAYGLMYGVLPRFWEGRRLQAVVLGMLTIIASIVFYRLTIVYIIYPYVYQLPFEAAPALQRIVRFFWTGIDLFSIAAIAMTIKLTRLRLQTLEHERELLRERHAAELRFLRSQLNPHFLFNTLNSIFALARHKDDRTAEVVARLAGMLRFMLYECDGATIPLSRERQGILDFIELETIRYGPRVRVELHEVADDWSQPIAPLLLLPLVENAFKHGVGERRFDCRVALSLRLQQGRFCFRTENDYDADSAPPADGIGLRNVRRQLELLYPNHHQLHITRQASTFRVELSINLAAHDQAELHHRRGRTAGRERAAGLHPADAHTRTDQYVP